MSADDRGAGAFGDRDALDAELASYALDGLSAAECIDLEQELATSPGLRAQLDSHRETVAALASVLAPVSPSAGLRGGLLAALATTAQLPESDAGRDDAAGVDGADRALDERITPARADAQPAPEAPPTGAERRAQARWFSRPVIAVASVAAAACLVLAGVAIGTGVGAPSPSAPAAAPTSGTSDESVALASILSSKDATSATTTLSDGATATVYASSSLKRSAIVWKGLPALPTTKTYEAWYITSKAVPAGTFSASGSTAYEVLEGDMPAKASVGITVEKAGGATEPNLDALLGTVSVA